MLAGGLLGAVAGRPLVATARKNTKKRCRKTGRACSSSRQCCSGRPCTDGQCCTDDRVFVECPIGCQCGENGEFCCVGESSGMAPDPDCADSGIAPELCCPPDNVCGNVCCDLFTEACVAGECVCRPENTCGADNCCDLRFCECNQQLGVCGFDCPSGGGGFLRVRRVR
jgi:hypothetical protein